MSTPSINVRGKEWRKSLQKQTGFHAPRVFPALQVYTCKECTRACIRYVGMRGSVCELPVCVYGIKHRELCTCAVSIHSLTCARRFNHSSIGAERAEHIAVQFEQCTSMKVGIRARRTCIAAVYDLALACVKDRASRAAYTCVLHCPHNGVHTVFREPPSAVRERSGR
jgi:hypothetical protein